MGQAETAHYHLVGIAGVGMNALGQILAAHGVRVTGSDRHADQGRDLDVLRKLRHGGVEIVPQDGSGILPGTRGVVLSTAIEEGNPDLAAARRLGVPVLHRSEMLAQLLEGRECVAVAGTSGKTTVTGMIGWILQCAGRDPTVVNGGAVMNWVTTERVGNVRVGRSDLWVIEADESDRSFLRYTPDWAVVTNISRDHFRLEETETLFRAFRSRVKKDAVGVLDKPGDLRVEASLTADGAVFTRRGLEYRLPLIGAHNVENALCAIGLCELLGVPPNVARDALGTFQGIQRRLEVVGRAGGVTVLDDYAHNPAKIGAAWRAVQPHARRVFGVWRPHGFAPLAAMMEEVAALFPALCRPEDRLFILPVYYAGGTAKQTVKSDDLVERLRGRDMPATLVADYAELAAVLPAELRPGDTVLIMGARDPDLPIFARRLAGLLTQRRAGRDAYPQD